MLYHLDQYISNSLTKVFEPAIDQRVKLTANTGMCLISTANTGLDGGGTLGTLIQGSGNGTLVETITIKAISNTTRGMVRLFLRDSEPIFTKLIAEIDIPEKTVSAVDDTFAITIQTDFMLMSGYSILASTEKAESFQVIAEGVNTAYP